MSDTSDNATDILDLIQPRFASSEDARIGFEEVPLPGFGGRTAHQLVEEGRGSEVREYISAVDGGIYA